MNREKLLECHSCLKASLERELIRNNKYLPNKKTDSKIKQGHPFAIQGIEGFFVLCEICEKDVVTNYLLTLMMNRYQKTRSLASPEVQRIKVKPNNYQLEQVRNEIVQMVTDKCREKEEKELDYLGKAKLILAQREDIRKWKTQWDTMVSQLSQQLQVKILLIKKELRSPDFIVRLLDLQGKHLELDNPQREIAQEYKFQWNIMSDIRGIIRSLSQGINQDNKKVYIDDLEDLNIFNGLIHYFGNYTNFSSNGIESDFEQVVKQELSWEDWMLRLDLIVEWFKDTAETVAAVRICNYEFFSHLSGTVASLSHPFIPDSSELHGKVYIREENDWTYRYDRFGGDGLYWDEREKLLEEEADDRY